MLIDADAALDYLGFVEERHRIWERRQAGETGPWTTDPILASRKFTNVFRVLDPGSQFVLELADPGVPSRDVLMRMFLYRHTNRVEPWEYVRIMNGAFPLQVELDDALHLWKEYRGESKEITCGTTTAGGGSRKGNIFQRQLFSGAYMVFPQSQVKGTDKIESVVRLTQRLFDPSSPDDIVPEFLEADTQEQRFRVLRRNKGVADFMSMQILTDWGYSPHSGEDREDEFVVLGPGARRGAQALLGKNSGRLDDVLAWAVDSIRSSLGCPTLPNGRTPSYMDTQNTLCEFSKYVRFMGKPSSTKPYEPAHPGSQPEPLLPAHWNR